MNETLTWRRASAADADFLAEWNHQLIRDEGHRNAMTVPELSARLGAWLAGEYAAVIFSAGEAVAYALFKDNPDETYLRQLFVSRSQRRKGVGREALAILRREFWPRDKRVLVEVLAHNQSALDFYRALGYLDYFVALQLPPAPP